MKLIITGTGTGVGKTFVTCALARSLRNHGSVIALKPFETGVEAHAEDENALEAAAGSQYHERFACLYRVPQPVAPYAATLEGEEPPASPEHMQAAIEALDADHVLVEGAGGLLVPIWSTLTFGDFVASLKWPLVVVATDGLGTIAHTLSCVEAARNRNLAVAAVVLNRGVAPEDPSQRTNQRVLSDFLDVPVVPFADDADAPALIKVLQGGWPKPDTRR